MSNNSHEADKLIYDLGYMVDNVLEGPNVVVAKSHVSPNHVNIIIGGRVVCVSFRQLLNALRNVRTTNASDGITIITPEVN